MKTSLAISSVGHAAVLAWGMLTFAAQPYKHDSAEALPVDVISATDFSQLTAGSKTAPQAETQRPLVEKVGEHKPVDDPNAKPADKKEVKAATDKPPVQEPKPPSPKAQPQPKVDLIAEALKKDEAKKPEPKKAEPKKAEAKTPTPPKKPAPPAVPAFDPNQVMALLDKRTPQRQAATGDTTNDTPSLGASQGSAAQLSQGELDGLRKRLSECWSPPAGAADAARLQVVIRVLFNPDGTVARPPALVAGTISALGPATAESAMRAILRCQPFDMLKPEHYEQWKDIEITFDPRDMFRG